MCLYIRHRCAQITEECREGWNTIIKFQVIIEFDYHVLSFRIIVSFTTNYLELILKRSLLILHSLYFVIIE